MLPPRFKVTVFLELHSHAHLQPNDMRPITQAVHEAVNQAVASASVESPLRDTTVITVGYEPLTPEPI